MILKFGTSRDLFVDSCNVKLTIKTETNVFSLTLDS